MKTYIIITKEGDNMLAEASNEEALVEGLKDEGYYNFIVFEKTGEYEQKIELVKIKEATEENV